MRLKIGWAVVGAALLLLFGGATESQANLVTNGGFEGTCTAAGNNDFIPPGWTLVETTPAELGSVLSCVPGSGPKGVGSQSLSSVRTGGGVSGDWTLAQQVLSIDATSLDELILCLQVQVTSHNLEAGGIVTPAFEWPVMVELQYDTDTTTEIWRHGFYVIPPGDGSRVLDPGAGAITEYKDTLVAIGGWSKHCFDLKSELPGLETITRIRVGGSGWDYDGVVDNVFIGTGEQVPSLSTWGVILLVVILLATTSFMILRRQRRGQLTGA